MRYSVNTSYQQSTLIAPCTIFTYRNITRKSLVCGTFEFDNDVFAPYVITIFAIAFLCMKRIVWVLSLPTESQTSWSRVRFLRLTNLVDLLPPFYPTSSSSFNISTSYDASLSLYSTTVSSNFAYALSTIFEKRLESITCIPTGPKKYKTSSYVHSNAFLIQVSLAYTDCVHQWPPHHCSAYSGRQAY